MESRFVRYKLAIWIRHETERKKKRKLSPHFILGRCEPTFLSENKKKKTWFRLCMKSEKNMS